MKRSEKIKVGVVGVGYLGSIHARIYSRMPDVTLVGVVDVDPAAAKRVAGEVNCEVFESVQALSDRVDAVSIVVPTSLHREVSEPFLKAKIPVLLEKPVAHTIEDAEVITSLAREQDTLLQIGHLERFNAGVIRLAQDEVLQPHRLHAGERDAGQPLTLGEALGAFRARQRAFNRL